jgi:hypothetical protein
MKISHRIGIVSISIGFGLSFFVMFAQAMSTYQATLAECQKRTGLSAGLCKSLVKKNLNVESCKKQTGLSDGECAKRIEEIKNDPEFSGRPASVPSRLTTPDERSAPSGDSPAEESGDAVVIWRAKKERELRELQARTKAIINFFRDKGADVTDVEARFGEFEKKSDELLVAYDTFQAVYVSTVSDPPATRKAIREEARDMVTRSRNSLVEYYRSNILTVLIVVREQIL